MTKYKTKKYKNAKTQKKWKKYKKNAKNAKNVKNVKSTKSTQVQKLKKTLERQLLAQWQTTKAFINICIASQMKQSEINDTN